MSKILSESYDTLQSYSLWLETHWLMTVSRRMTSMVTLIKTNLLAKRAFGQNYNNNNSRVPFLGHQRPFYPDILLTLSYCVGGWSQLLDSADSAS
jgi:hypothetical protein